MHTDPNGQSFEHRAKALRPALAVEDASVGFDYDVVDAAMGETVEDFIADAINEAAAGKNSTAKANVARIRAILQRDCEDVLHRVVALCETTIRCILIDIQTAPKGTEGREATYHRMAFDMRESNDESMRKVARGWGVSVEAVSKRVSAIRERHKRAIGTFNKPAALAGVYRDRNNTRRAKV